MPVLVRWTWCELRRQSLTCPHAPLWFKVVADVQYKEHPDGPWKYHDKFTVGNFLASNMPKLGPKHVIHSNVKVDDGMSGIVYTLPTAKKVDLWRANNKMKSGQALSDAKGWESARFSEFKMKLTERTPLNSCIMLDGDPSAFHGDEIHVEVLKQALPIHSMSWMMTADAEPGSDAAKAEVGQIVRCLQAQQALALSTPTRSSKLAPLCNRWSSGTPAAEVLARRVEKGMGRVPVCPDGIRITPFPVCSSGT